MTVDHYLAGEESNRRRELIFGMVHDPPSPFPFHQELVTRLASLLHQHVVAERAGTVYVSPLDVVLDDARGLVLQPDILFVATANQAIVRDRIWGAPDLVIEVLSAGTHRRDRVAKRAWYLHYLVKEYWLVDPVNRAIEIVGSPNTSRVYGAGDRVRSAVLPRFNPAVEDVL